MRLLSLLLTVSLTLALAYYIYIPLPDAIQQPWKLMMLNAYLRTSQSFTKNLDLFCYFVRFKTVISIYAGAVPGVKVSDITFAGIPVRVYEPPAGGEGHLRRGLMYFHGGGWGSYDITNRMVSDELNTVVVSVEYRLYPDAHFPVPYLDCLAAAKHFLSPEVLAKYSIDPDRVAVAGDSAGGNLAAAVITQGNTKCSF
uniref:Neutral cholesterol ester hydrolase 1a n=1 Tax=Oreochromis niloticus TaxID=8128 RepID=A0A669D8G3_ORENI